MLHLNRNQFRTSFSSENLPHWSCTWCAQGTFKVVGDIVSVDCAATLSDLQKYSDLPWEAHSQRFSCRLECGHCKETVFVVGDASIEAQLEEHDGSGGGYYLRLTPTFFEPPLGIVSLPVNCPDKVAHAVIDACRFYWSSPSIAASLLRKSLERLLDAEGVAVAVDKIDGKGKGSRLNLHQRIELFAQTPKCDVDLLKALRLLGNVSSVLRL
ncbi:DUF4145 domain-containing protein [Herminiimonas aquatilis]|uniref:DUF4145 domain-containing protein n=1 Tax=Herminiimonas aquatilis TaxID=345342 RepID=A0ABW2JAF2_9BURK